MVEITAEEQNKGKGMKRIEEILRDLWDNIRCTNIQIIGVPEAEDKKKGYEKKKKKGRVWEKFWRDYSWKFPQHWKVNSHSSPRGTKTPIQDKPKEKHARTHTNQTNKE